jgi:hypothetical protein
MNNVPGAMVMRPVKALGQTPTLPLQGGISKAA